MAWAQRDPKDHPAPNSLPLHQTRLLHALSTLGLEHLQGCPSFLSALLSCGQRGKTLKPEEARAEPAVTPNQPQPQLSPGQHCQAQGSTKVPCSVTVPLPHTGVQSFSCTFLPSLTSWQCQKIKRIFYFSCPIHPQRLSRGRSRYPEQRWEPLIPTASAQL